MENKEKLIIIDGNSLMHRAFYAVPQTMTNSKGLHTNVIYGFVNMLNKILNEYKPQYIAIAFDRKAPTFRHIEYAEYKAGRKKMPEEMAEQIPVLKEVLSAMNIKQIELDGYEADDILGTVAKYADVLKIPTLIVTGDRDALQLISDHVHIMITKKGISEMEEYDTAKLQEVYNLAPAQITDLKGLMGDASDNIPGVPGIGEKTALALLEQFGNIENILENTSDIKKNKVRENIENNKEQAVFSKKLATIMREVPFDFDIQEFTFKEADSGKLYDLYTQLGFKTFLAKMSQKAGDKAPTKTNAAPLNIKALETSEAMAQMMEEAKKAGKIAVKIDTKTSQMLNRIYVALADTQYHFLINDNTKEFIKSLMEDAEIAKIGYDIKQEMITLRHMGIQTAGEAFDTMIAAYLLNPSKSAYPIDQISEEMLGVTAQNFQSKEGDEVTNYSGSVKAILDLEAPLAEKLKEYDMYDLFKNVEMPLAAVLADMEYEGFNVDKNMLEALSVEFAGQIDALTQSIYFQAGEQFNINSTKQLGTILFDKLGLPVVKKTKTGYSTDVEVLEQLADKHPLIELILEYRQLLKLKSTYIDGLINIINPETGKIHTKLNQTVTATGRLSSTEPNLQNIPVKTENGRQIRKVFIPKDEDHILVDADYSQIELRVLAHISEDETFIDAFKKNEDIHTRTASEVFNVPISEVTSLMRARAKAVNFGIVYGISDFGLATDLKITKKEAKQYIESYLDRYPKVRQYMEDTVAQAKKDGFVTTILKRRRYIPEISSRNAIQRNFGERMAMNTPIQGSAADIIKMAMVKVYHELKNRNMKSKLILQVHDELIVETYKPELEAVKKILKESMENAVSLTVPLTVEAHEGYNWYEAK